MSHTIEQTEATAAEEASGRVEAAVDPLAGIPEAERARINAAGEQACAAAIASFGGSITTTSQGLAASRAKSSAIAAGVAAYRAAQSTTSHGCSGSAESCSGPRHSPVKVGEVCLCPCHDDVPATQPRAFEARAHAATRGDAAKRLRAQMDGLGPEPGALAPQAFNAPARLSVDAALNKLRGARDELDNVDDPTLGHHVEVEAALCNLEDAIAQAQATERVTLPARVVTADASIEARADAARATFETACNEPGQRTRTAWQAVVRAVDASGANRTAVALTDGARVLLVRDGGDIPADPTPLDTLRAIAALCDSYAPFSIVSLLVPDVATVDAAMGLSGAERGLQPAHEQDTAIETTRASIGNTRVTVQHSRPATVEERARLEAEKARKP